MICCWGRGWIEKNYWYHCGIIFQGVPLEGGGVQKNFCEKCSGSKNLTFLEIYPTPLNLEGARRILFKVSIDISANMGGICV